MPEAIVNDVHSRLNRTRVADILRPRTVEAVQAIVRQANDTGRGIALCGSRHAMGGQQFLTDRTLVDLTGLNRILHFDQQRGLVTAEAGITWPALIEGYLAAQERPDPSQSPRWGIAQKQTGADDLTLGGALSANIHGRGLNMAPIVQDVESFTLVSPSGALLECSRRNNPDLFRLVIGGYGLFGPIVSVTLRLQPRRVLRRVVRVIDIDDAVHAVRRRIEEGFLFGDFQFDVDPRSPEFLTKGVFSCYQPVEGVRPPEHVKEQLTDRGWRDLLLLAHTDKGQAFAKYAEFYLRTDGQLYWSDTHQLGIYPAGYHEEIDRTLHAANPGGEMITELYVPTDDLIPFLRLSAAMLTERQAEIIYGTIRLARADTETFLPWASDDRACVIFNLHVEHSPPRIAAAADALRGLIDIALGFGGSFYLTYHRFATQPQLLAAYPQLPEFLKRKDAHDPGNTFTSDWHRWLRATLSA